MPARIKKAKPRLVISRLAMKLIQLVDVSFTKTGKFGSSADDVMLLLGIYIGQAEGRPMTAGKLAEYVGIPRATVIRKTREMQERGWLDQSEGAALTVPLHRLNSPDVMQSVEDATSAIIKAAADLSKLDANPVVDLKRLRS